MELHFHITTSCSFPFCWFIWIIVKSATDCPPRSHNNHMQFATNCDYLCKCPPTCRGHRVLLQPVECCCCCWMPRGGSPCPTIICDASGKRQVAALRCWEMRQRIDLPEGRKLRAIKDRYVCLARLSTPDH